MAAPKPIYGGLAGMYIYTCIHGGRRMDILRTTLRLWSFVEFLTKSLRNIFRKKNPNKVVRLWWRSRLRCQRAFPATRLEASELRRQGKAARCSRHESTKILRAALARRRRKTWVGSGNISRRRLPTTPANSELADSRQHWKLRRPLFEKSGSLMPLKLIGGQDSWSGYLRMKNWSLCHSAKLAHVERNSPVKILFAAQKKIWRVQFVPRGGQVRLFAPNGSF